MIAYLALERYDISVTSWKLDAISRILKKPMFYVYGLWYVACTVTIYTVYPKVYGALKGLDLSRSETLMIIGLLAVASVPMRWVWGYIGDRTKHWILPTLALAVYIPACFLVPIYPIVMIPLFFLAMSMVTQNMWPWAREWAGKKDIGTAMGMMFVVAYLMAGYVFGKW